MRLGKSVKPRACLCTGSRANTATFGDGACDSDNNSDGDDNGNNDRGGEMAMAIVCAIRGNGVAVVNHALIRAHACDVC